MKEFFKVIFYRGTKLHVEAGFVSRDAAEKYADVRIIQHCKQVQIISYFESR